MKSVVFIAMLAASFLVTAETSQTSQNSHCPDSWFDIRLPEGSKTCRIFGVKKPSTLSFFVNQQPASVSQQLAQQLSIDTVKSQGRYLTITSPDMRYRGFVYADGAGTQVNLMIH